MTDTLNSWNVAPAPEAEAALLSTCASPTWACVLVLRRPYTNLESLLVDAEAAWFELPEDEWLEAFAAHPRIGERKADASTTPQFAASSESEQLAAQATLTPFADRLIAANREYEQRFGFLYIVFANHCTAPQLLAILEERLHHDRPSELLEAARQQWQITRHRMFKWLNPEAKIGRET